MLRLFSFSFNGVAPICLMMIIGTVLRKTGLLPREAASKMNRVAFSVLVPCKLFSQVCSADLQSVADPFLIFCCLGLSVLVLAALCIGVPGKIPAGPARAEFIQGVYRGNAAILGLPLLENREVSFPRGYAGFFICRERANRPLEQGNLPNRPMH